MGEAIEIGQLIADRYTVEALLGSGGIADVYKVRHTELGSLHALKILTWRKKALADRFVDEGRFQANLGHPNVVTVTDILRFDGQVALIMEFVDGITLEDLLEQRGALPVQEAFALFVPILAAVAAAHDRRVFHRDLKPANVLLARTPVGWVPKVADFGIAKFLQEEMGGGNTATGMIMGTPGYMAPEQVRDSSTVDERADIFALGAILFEMLSGQRAFADADGRVFVTSTVDREPPGLAVPGVSPEIASALKRAMAQNREHRFPDCRAFARGLGVGAHPLLLDMAEVGFSPSVDASAAGSPSTLAPRPSSERRASTTATWLVLPIAAGGLALLGIAAVLVAVIALVWTLRTGSETAVLDPIRPPTPAPIAEPAPTEPVEPDVGEPEGGEPDGEVPPEPAAPAPAAPAPAAVVPAPAEPAPAAPALPEPVEPAQPEPAQPEPAQPEPAQPEPAQPEPDDAVAVVEPAPAPAPSFDPTGTWTGRAGGRPFELRLSRGAGSAVTAEVVFVFGTSTRREPLTGTFDAASGRLDLRSGDGSLRFEGRRNGSGLSGTYSQGRGRPLDWSAAR